MGDSDRLNNLRQQRAKIAEHLAWLDREISASSGSSSAKAASRPSLKLRETKTVVTPVQLEANNPSPGISADPNAVLDQWVESQGPAAPAISKTGCWIAFSAVTAVCILALLAILKFYY